jgi:hypothetical protein
MHGGQNKIRAKKIKNRNLQAQCLRPHSSSLANISQPLHTHTHTHTQHQHNNSGGKPQVTWHAGGVLVKNTGQHCVCIILMEKRKTVHTLTMMIEYCMHNTHGKTEKRTHTNDDDIAAQE